MDGVTYEEHGDNHPDDVYVNRLMEHSFSEVVGDDEERLAELEDADEDEWADILSEGGFDGATYLGHDSSSVWILY